MALGMPVKNEDRYLVLFWVSFSCVHIGGNFLATPFGGRDPMCMLVGLNAPSL